MYSRCDMPVFTRCPYKFISGTEDEMDNQTVIAPTSTIFPTGSETNPGNQSTSYGWVAWMGLCVLTVVLVSVTFYRLLLEMQKFMVNIYNFILLSLLLSILLKIVKRENCGIYTLKGERRSCICFRKNTDPSRVTSL